MGITNYDIVRASQFIGPVNTNPFGRVLYVDPNQGNNRSGFSPEEAFTTMDAAFDILKSGDTIYFRGNVTEQLSTPAGVFDVTIIGAGNRPRHADAHTGNGGYSAATWKFPSSGGSASTPLLIVRQQGWRFINFLVDGPASAAAIQLFRDGGSGDAEDDASHAHFIGMKFVAAQNHIEVKGGLSQIVIENCQFFGATGASIIETVGAGIGTNNHFIIQNNTFQNNASHIICNMNYAVVRGNAFGAFTASSGFGIDCSGGSNNVIYGNYFSGDYDGDYESGTSDEWAGNFSQDAASDEVGDNALTTTTPVA